MVCNGIRVLLLYNRPPAVKCRLLNPKRCVRSNPFDIRLPSGLGRMLRLSVMNTTPPYVLLCAILGLALILATFVVRMDSSPNTAHGSVQIEPIQMGVSALLWRSYAGVPDPLELQADIPETIRLDTLGKRGVVIFPHQLHFRAVRLETEARSCQVCHHTAEAREMPATCSPCHEMQPNETAPKRERAFHRSCRDCHREEDAGPTKCSECHVK